MSEAAYDWTSEELFRVASFFFDYIEGEGFTFQALDAHVKPKRLHSTLKGPEFVFESVYKLVTAAKKRKLKNINAEVLRHKGNIILVLSHT